MAARVAGMTGATLEQADGTAWMAFYCATMLAMAMVYHFTVHNKAALSANPSGPRGAKVVAVISLVLWFGVGAAGRAIGFV